MLVSNLITENAYRKIDHTGVGKAVTHGSYEGSHKIYGSRGLTMGGSMPPGDSPGTWVWNTIDYISIGIGGNAIDFGEPLHLANQQSNGGSTQTRGVWCGGSQSTPSGGTDVLNTMSYVTIATTGNAIDFGDLSEATRAHPVMSDSHGGLGCY